MAGSYNKVLLMGNLTRDPELKHVGSGSKVAKFGLAINRKYKTSSGESRDETTFVDCEAWGKTAETIAQYLAKGRPVFIDGRLRLDQWEKEGEKRSKLLVVVDGFQFVDSKPGSFSDGVVWEDLSDSDLAQLTLLADNKAQIRQEQLSSECNRAARDMRTVTHGYIRVRVPCEEGE